MPTAAIDSMFEEVKQIIDKRVLKSYNATPKAPQLQTKIIKFENIDYLETSHTSVSCETLLHHDK